LEDAKVAASVEPKSAESLLRLAQCHHKLNNLEEAMHYYEMAIKLDSKNVHAQAEYNKLSQSDEWKNRTPKENANSELQDLEKQIEEEKELQKKIRRRRKRKR